MLTLTSEYALRALIHLAQKEGEWPIPGRTIAESAQIPPKYLSKVLGDLVRHGILVSSPGRTGGFSLKRAAKKMTLFQVLSAFEPFEKKRCPFGNKQCSDRNPCLAHDEWSKVVEAERNFLQRTTIFEIAVRKNTKKRK